MTNSFSYIIKTQIYPIIILIVNWNYITHTDLTVPHVLPQIKKVLLKCFHLYINVFIFGHSTVYSSSAWYYLEYHAHTMM